MRPHSRWSSDAADPLIRRTLRSWVSSVGPPSAGKKRLLAAAWLASANRSSKSKATRSTSADLAETLLGVVATAFADPVENSVQRALAGGVAHREPYNFLTGHVRRDGWHPFSFGIGLLSVIR